MYIYIYIYRYGGLPAAAYGEYNIIGMYFRIALHKLDARRVLPVAHGLFEEGFVEAAEVTVDLVGDDTVVPNALLFGCYGTRHAITMLWPLQIAGQVERGKRGRDRMSCGHIKIFAQQLWTIQIKVGYTWRMCNFNCRQSSKNVCWNFCHANFY